METEQGDSMISELGRFASFCIVIRFFEGVPNAFQACRSCRFIFGLWWFGASGPSVEFSLHLMFLLYL